MKHGKDNLSVYLLIDNGLLDEVSASYTEEKPTSRPSWLAPIYPAHAMAVTPLLIDLEAAYDAGDLDRVMTYANARRPALHVSIIETRLALEEIAQHLRRFIFIVSPEGKQFTLRFADCAVLAPLSSLLAPSQWATMKGPIVRWSIHDRCGTIVQLPMTELPVNEPTPLHLDHDQLAALDEASEPDHFIAKVKMMRNAGDFAGSTAEQYVWALAARESWRAAGNTNPLILLFLTEAALASGGRALRNPEVQNALAMDEVSAFRSKLRNLI